MHVGAFRIQPGNRSPSGGQSRKAEIADMAAELAVLRVIVDELSVGIVLLDSEYRVQFINRAFRRSWRVPESMVAGEVTFARLMNHHRSTDAYAASYDRMDEHVAEQMNMIRTGEEGPLQIRFADGTVSQFRCKALPNGGRLLTYGDVSELTRQADALEQLAAVDGMTGLNNRRNFLLLAESEWSRFKRYGQPLALLMIDIDLFKSVNDTYGHDAGDEVIKAVAEILQSHKRASDIAGRLGGEEFALILPEATLDRAASAAERLRQLVADRVVIADGRAISVTISIGVSVCHADTSGIDELLKQADVALYQAKLSGRNRVCRFDPYQLAELAIASTQTP